MNSQTDNQKRFYIHTLGCKVNQYESQAMREILERSGFKECLSKEMADIYIINTCTVTEHADRESRYSIGLLHRTNPKARIVVTGCYVEKDADDVSFLPGISHIIKNGDKSRIAEILDEQRITNDERRKDGFPAMRITGFKNHTKAFVKIQDGCENFCSYCKVPFVRGRLNSKGIKDIVNEVSTLVSNGFKEIVLTGICLGAWGRDLFPDELARSVGFSGASIVDVLKALVKIDGEFRIRLSSVEPKYVTDELIGFIRSNEKICRHLHIPLQSGDDEILKRMNRPYDSGEYKSLVCKLASRIDGIAITTDVLVGFPGESEKNFRNTVNFIKDIMPSRTHIFTFSKRKDTAAYSMQDEVADSVLKKRYQELKTTALSASYLYRSRFLGKKLDILVETKRDRHSGLLVGYSGNYIRVLFEGSDDLMRRIVPVQIDEINLIRTMGSYGQP